MASINGWINGVYDVSYVKGEMKALEKECRVQSSLFGMNGNNCLSFFYDKNHYGVCFEKVKRLFLKIAENREAYGILYIQDDESKAYHDTFQVYVARKGVVESVDDLYLSPCSEKIWRYDED